MYLNIKNKLGTINCFKKNVIRNRYVMTQYYVISIIISCLITFIILIVYNNKYLLPDFSKYVSVQIKYSYKKYNFSIIIRFNFIIINPFFFLFYLRIFRDI